MAVLKFVLQRASKFCAAAGEKRELEPARQDKEPRVLRMLCVHTVKPEAVESLDHARVRAIRLDGGRAP